METEHLVKRAAAICGSQHNLAVKLGVTRQYINAIINTGRACPANLCIAVEQATNGRITRYQLRPDVFGTAEQAA